MNFKNEIQKSKSFLSFQIHNWRLVGVKNEDENCLLTPLIKNVRMQLSVKDERGYKMTKWTAEWTGRYPCVCSGEWKLFKNGEPVQIFPPFHDTCAGTFGTYDRWSFNEDWSEEWEQYEDGLFCEDWCAYYSEWLETIAPKEEWEAIFDAFQQEDWRHGCCGGCI